MPDELSNSLAAPQTIEGLLHSEASSLPRKSSYFWLCKRAFDIMLAIFFVPLVLVSAAVLLVLNHFFNRGPLMFSQKRMGRREEPFRLYKFRSMVPAEEFQRGAFSPLEVDRITPLGYWLRRTRFDELPQVFNILRGDMSFIGPRPHAFEHAIEYRKVIPGYRRRHLVRPGLSGLAQVRMGYTEDLKAVQLTVRKDLVYAKRAGFRLEMAILAKTVVIVLSGHGAR
jgi:lipopolysaccharide/colanic/teichoic acid biosynthesis glycosyltransferase